MSERSEHVVAALRENFEPQQLSVHYIATDCASSKFFEEARDVCPNLAAVCLDPIHLARVYEYGQWNKKTAGSKSLSQTGA